MSNLFVDLPLPVLNGPGVAVNTSGMGSPKTIEVVGNFQGASITVEASVDGGTVWGAVTTFTNVGDQRVIEVAAEFMRVRVSGRKGAFSANCDVGAPDIGSLFAVIPMPVLNGPGPAVDVSTFGTLCTFIAGGSFPSASIRVEISEDGIAWAPLLAFSGKGGLRSVTVTAAFVRANVSGATAGFSGTLAMGGASLAGTGPTYGLGPTNPGILQPPFTPLVTTIYARTTGSDVTGDGSLATPYRTMQRAVRDVPSIVGPGVRYVVDISGAGGVQFTETLPLEYELPCWKAPEVFADQAADPFVAFIAAVAIEAQPQLMSTLSVADATITQPADLNVGGFPASGITAINAAGVPAGYSFDPITGMLTLHLLVARPAWLADALKGKFLTDVDPLTVGNAVISASTDTSVSFNQSIALGGVLSVKEPSAWLKTQSVPSLAAHRGGFNASNIDSIAINGLKITPLSGNFGLSTVGNGYSSVQLCELENANLSSFNLLTDRVIGCWIRGARVRFQGPVSLQRSLLQTIPTVNAFSFLQLHMRHVVLDGCGTLSAARSVFAGAGMQTVPADLFFAEQCTFRNGTSIAVQFNGGRARFFATDFASNAGDAIRMQGGPGFAEVLSCGSSIPNDAGTYGVNVTDGMYCKVDAGTSGFVTPGSLTPLTGGLGDMKVGGQLMRTWPDFRTGASGMPALNELDLIATPGVSAGGSLANTALTAAYITGTGSRLYQ